MSQVFEPIQLVWKDKEYTIPGNKVMGCIRSIEDVITLDQLAAYADKQSAPTGKLASAYARALRYAGVPVSDDEVYLDFTAELEDEEQGPLMMMAAIQAIMVLMLPPKKRKAIEKAMEEGTLDKLQEGLPASDTVGKLKDGVLPGLPTKPSRSQSGGVGSHPVNSGRSTRKSFGSSSKPIRRKR